MSPGSRPDCVAVGPGGRTFRTRDEARLVGMQLQSKLREPSAKLRQEPHGVGAVLGSNDEVVGVAHDDDVAVRLPLPPLLDPKVEDVVQVDVRQQGDIVAPCGEPTSLSVHFPCSITPAASHFWMSRRILRSPTLCSTNFTSQPWSMASKKPRMSASSTQFTFLLQIPTTSASSALCCPRPGRNP